jgi:hypothetical protein
MRRENAYAMHYRGTDEKVMVESSLNHLEDATENGDDGKRSSFLLFLLLALINTRKRVKLKTSK